MPDIAFTEELAQCIRYMFIEVSEPSPLPLLRNAIYTSPSATRPKECCSRQQS